jgi:hypothetical protein
MAASDLIDELSQNLSRFIHENNDEATINVLVDIINTITDEKSLLPKFLGSGGVENTITATKAFKTSYEVQIFGCSLLSVCSSFYVDQLAQEHIQERQYKREMSKFRSLGVYDLALNTFRSDPNDELSCRMAALLIIKLIWYDYDIHFFDEIDNELIATMKKFPDEEFFDAACYLIEIFCGKNVHRSQQMGELGACELVHNSLIDKGEVRSQLYAIDSLLRCVENCQNKTRRDHPIPKALKK